MKIEEGNEKKTTRIDNRFLVSLILALAIFMISGSIATRDVFAVTQPTTELPSCTDPTGQNLPCMIVISTLPPPPNAIQCQETSGHILPCSYSTQNLSNGERIVAIIVYVPANFVFSSPTVIKVIVHQMTTSSTTGGGGGNGQNSSHKLLVAIGVAKDPIVRGNIQTITVTVADSKKPSMKIAGVAVNGKVTYVTGHLEPLTGVTNGQVYSHQWRISGDATPGKFKVQAQAFAGGKSGSATTTFMVIPKTNTTTTPINMTKDNMTVAASGGKGTGPSCFNNCTTGTSPSVDCKTNPNDPSCLPVPQSAIPPSTKTCPDGSVIDASASCPTQSTSPSTSGGTPPSKNPSPPSSNNNGGGGSGSGSGGSGSGSGGSGSGSGGSGSGGGGSNTPQPSTLS
jgi:uncharacterized membrane protein YgcG